MAPEQAAGKEEISTAADFYSLGVILYELLIGRPPIVGATVTETLEMVQKVEPEPPRKINARVDRDLEAICLKCLRKDPTQRYGTAEDIADDLHRYVDGRPTRARPVGGARRLGKWVRRRPAIAALTLAVFLSSVLALGSLFLQMWKASEAKKDRENLLYVSLIQQAKGHVEFRQLDLAEKELARCPKHLRQWEWYLLKNHCRRVEKVLEGHKAAIQTVQYSPDGKRVVTASWDSTAIIWDPETGKAIHTLKSHKGWVNSACFGCDGKYVFTAGFDRKVKVWDADSGKELRELPLEGDFVTSAANGNHVAVRTPAGSVCVVNAETGEIVFEKEYPPTRVMNIALSPDGRYLAVAGWDRLLQVHNLAEKTHTVYSFDEGDIGSNNVWSVTFSPDSRRFAAGSNTFYEWDVVTGKRESRYSGGGDFIALAICYSFSPDSQNPALMRKRLAATDRDGETNIWDCRTGKRVVSPRKYRDIIPCVAFNPADGRKIAVVRHRNVTIENVDPEHDLICQELKGHSFTDVVSLAFYSSGEEDEKIVTRACKREVLQWDLATGKPITLASPMADLTDGANLAISPGDAPSVVCGQAGDRLAEWNLQTGQEGVSPRVSVPSARLAAFSADGRYLALAESGNRIHIWDRHTHQKTRTLGEHSSNTFYSLAFRPGQAPVLAAGDRSGSVRMWDVSTGTELSNINTGRDSVVTWIAFSPDARRLATGQGNGFVHVWDVASGEEITNGGERKPDTNEDEDLDHPFRPGHSGRVTCVAYGPDGRRLASCGYDGTVKLWDAETGREILTLLDIETRINCVAFSQDGYRLACCANDGTVRIWDARTVEEPEVP